jgi:hypothetical protein
VKPAIRYLRAHASQSGIDVAESTGAAGLHRQRILTLRDVSTDIVATLNRSHA